MHLTGYCNSFFDVSILSMTLSFYIDLADAMEEFFPPSNVKDVFNQMPTIALDVFQCRT